MALNKNVQTFIYLTNTILNFLETKIAKNKKWQILINYKILIAIVVWKCFLLLALVNYLIFEILHQVSPSKLQIKFSHYSCPTSKYSGSRLMWPLWDRSKLISITDWFWKPELLQPTYTKYKRVIWDLSSLINLMPLTDWSFYPWSHKEAPTVQVTWSMLLFFFKVLQFFQIAFSILIGRWVKGFQNITYITVRQDWGRYLLWGKIIPSAFLGSDKAFIARHPLPFPYEAGTKVSCCRDSLYNTLTT